MKISTCAVLLAASALTACTDRAHERIASLTHRATTLFGAKEIAEKDLLPPAPPSDSLALLASWDTIGMNLAYVKKLAGPPIRSQDHQHEFVVQGCRLVLTSDNEDQLVRSVQVAVASECDLDAGALLGLGKRLPLSTLTFGAFDDAMGSGQYLADCLRDCGNAYVPHVYLSVMGSRALQFKDVMLSASIASDDVMLASRKWADVMVDRESEDWVVRDWAFNCQPAKYRDVAAIAFRNIKPQYISFGDELIIPQCIPQQSSASANQATEGSKASTGLIPVPRPSGQCDMDYGKRLDAVGLKASEVAVHGPEDEDFKGYGCAYRITPAPAQLVAPGSTVTYRSAWEGG